MAKLKRKVSSESWEQEQLFKWASVQQLITPDLRFLISSMSGVRLSMGAAIKAKQQGNKPGFPDVFLPTSNGQYHGLFIEMKKRKGGKVSEYQKRWLEHLDNKGYRAVVCYGYEEAVAEIKKYLGGL